MPPPRLSRHLRPCHLTVTAKQVRCVHTTGRAKLSTTGYDTTPQTPSAKGSNGEGSALSDPTDSKNDTPAKEKPWWKKALAHIAPFSKYGEQFESIESKLGQSPPHIEQPERPAINLQETEEKPGREERGFTQLAVSSTARQQGMEAQSGQMRFADCRKDDFASAQQVDMAAMQQQIHRLTEQIRALEARLETGSPTGQSSTSAGVLRTLAIRPEATQFKMDNQDLAYPTQTLSHVVLSTRMYSAKGRLIQQRAGSIYAGSVACYAKLVAQLTRLPPHLVAPAVPTILRHFRSIRGVAMLDDDSHIIQIFWKYQLTINRLESILRKSSIPAPSLGDPMVADEVAKFSKALCYDNLISHTLDACRKRYSRAFLKLQELVKELGRLQSPMVAPIVSRARGQLLKISAEVYEGGDGLLIDLMEAHCDIKGLLWKRNMLAPAEPSVLIPKSADTREKDMQNNIAENEDDGQRLMRQVQTQWQPVKSSTDLRTNSKDHGLEISAPEQRPNIKDSMPSNRLSNAEAPTATQTTKPSTPPLRTDEVSEQSLLEELFPETNRIPQPQPTKKNRDQYPRLELPKSRIRPVLSKQPRTLAQQAAENIQQHGEQISVLQLSNCSTGLTEADFRRIIPKGKHLEGWRRDSDFYKVIPGRDPLSLERLPFYYLLFKNTEAALSYQKNASRLHKLSARYQPSSILSAIPPPKGFLEDGEDIAAAVASYNLLPKNHSLSLNVVMQPYNPALRQLIERGGYQVIATSAEDKRKKICRVLLHIEGWEPSPSDLFAAITRDAYRQGMLHPLRNESQSSIHRLRDLINLKISSKAVSSSRPRSYGTFDHSAKSALGSELTYDDPEIQSMMGSVEEDRSQAQMNQEVMNRVYNRWILDFEDVNTARRWSLRWHRRPLPRTASEEATWKDDEEARICNTEVLW